MMKVKLALITFILMIFLVGSISAITWDNVGYYKLDETTGTIVYDSTGTNNGTAYNGTLIGQTGKINTAYYFDGVDDLVLMDNESILRGDTGIVSGSFWFKSNSSNVYIISKGNSWVDNDANGWAIRLNNSGFLQLIVYNANIKQESFSNEQLNDSQWHHVYFQFGADGQKLYIDGVKEVDNLAANQNAGIGTGEKKPLAFGSLYRVTLSAWMSFYNGYLDEVGFWNRSLSEAEILELYNSSYGLSYNEVPSIGITLYLPPNNSVENENVTLIATASNGGSGVNLSNMTFYTWYSNGSLFNQTTNQISGEMNTSSVTIYNFNLGNYTWSASMCLVNGSCYSADENRTFFVDTLEPQIVILEPNGTTYDIPSYGDTLNLVGTITDDYLDACWYEYNNTNTTFSCSSGIEFNISFNQTYETSMIVYARDLVGNIASENISWSYEIFNLGEEYNPSTYETSQESFTINFSYDSSKWGSVSAKLNYDGTNYTATKVGTGNNISFVRTITIPTVSGTTNKSFYWIILLTNTTGTYEIRSTEYNQTIKPIIFTQCNSTYTTKYINFTFKDESTLAYTDGYFPSATFQYWLGDGTYKKTYLFENTTNVSSYAFCFSPADKTLNVDMLIYYKNSESPQRVYDPTTIQLTNSTTYKTLYLLKSSDGSYAYFIVYDATGNPLSGVSVVVTREISGQTIEVGYGTTDDSGAVNFWINPDFPYTYTFTKSGYASVTKTLTIGDSTPRIIILGGGLSQPDISDYLRKVIITITPSGDYLENNTIYTFNYTISTSYWTFDEWGFTLKYGNGTIIGTKSSVSDVGGSLTLTANTSNETRIIMDYYFVVNSTYVNMSRIWLIYEKKPFGIINFFIRLNSYISANLFGILGDEGTDYFGKALLSVIVLIFITGIMSYRYGFRSDVFALGIIFGLILLLNSMNLLPNPDFFSGNGVELGDFIVYITGALLIGFIIKEEMR